MTSEERTITAPGLSVHTTYARGSWWWTPRVVSRWFEWHSRTATISHRMIADGVVKLPVFVCDIKPGSKIKVGGSTVRVLETNYYDRSVLVYRGSLYQFPFVARKLHLFWRKTRARIIFKLDVWGLATVPEMAECSWLDVHLFAKIHNTLKTLHQKFFGTPS